VTVTKTNIKLIKPGAGIRKPSGSFKIGINRSSSRPVKQQILGKEKITKNMSSSGVITQLSVQDHQSSAPADPDQTSEVKAKKSHLTTSQ
jgi:hypothetical protein